MERTALNVTSQDHVSCDVTKQFETIQNARVILGGYNGRRESERADSRICVNVGTLEFNPWTGKFDNPVNIQLWFTPTQLAEIVKEYFSTMLHHTKPVWRQLLERLLRKRWSVMTSSTYKREIAGTDRVKPYHKMRE